MHLDAERGQLLDIHVTARAGAEEHDVFQTSALFSNVCRKVRMIDDRDRGIAEYAGQLIRRHVLVAVNADIRVAGLALSFEQSGERCTGIDEYGFHFATPASDRTVCSKTLAPAVQSACVASSSSL